MDNSITLYGRFRWNTLKNIKLFSEKHIQFLDIIHSIQQGNLLDTQDNPSTLHTRQKIFIVQHGGYVYVVPFIYEESTDTFFLKTIYPSRKYKKQFIL
jgi:hypothetical protein